MKNFNISYLVDGETHGFSFHFDKDPKEKELDVLIGNAVRGYLSDLDMNEHNTKLEFLRVFKFILKIASLRGRQALY